MHPPYDTVLRRRRLLGVAAAAAAFAIHPALLRAQSLPAVDRPEGGFRFVPGNQVFATGAVALPGFEIVHVMLDRWLELQDGYRFVEEFLRSAGRPMQSLCGMELRLPRQLSMDGFRAFNGPYVERLVSWGLLAEGRNPVSRTNVAPVFDPPEMPSLHAFSFARAGRAARPPFVLSGMAENGPAGVVAAGDDSAAGFAAKTEFLVRAFRDRMQGLGVSFGDATHVDVYCAHPERAPVTDVLMPALEFASRRGVRVHCARPPVEGLEVELEVRAFAAELVAGR